MKIRKLGRKAIKIDSRTLKLARYIKALPPAPASRNWLHVKGGVDVPDWGMMLNDALGDCTIAACGHAIQVWSLNASAEQTVSNSNILSAYEDWCGYDPADPETDQGGIELDVLTDWKRAGLAGHKLTAFASVDVSNLEEVRQAIDLFGGIYIGIALPITAQDQTSWHYVPNTPDNEPWSWGGHAVFVPKYSAAGLTAITWGQSMWMSNYFWQTYVDEAYALVSVDFLNTQGDTPDGFNLSQLLADLAQIR